MTTEGWALIIVLGVIAYIAYIGFFFSRLPLECVYRRPGLEEWAPYIPWKLGLWKVLFARRLDGEEKHGYAWRIIHRPASNSGIKVILEREDRVHGIGEVWREVASEQANTKQEVAQAEKELEDWAENWAAEQVNARKLGDHIDRGGRR